MTPFYQRLLLRLPRSWNFPSSGGNLRVFPEQTTPDKSSLKNVVDLVFTTLPANIDADAKFFYRRLDPDNNIGLGSDGAAADAWTGEDNYGEKSSLVFSATIPAGGTLPLPFEIDPAHAGDNWILLASASQARVIQTKMDESSKANRYNVITTAANPYTPFDYALGMTRVPNLPNTIFVFNGTIDKYAGTNLPEHKVIIDDGPPDPYVYPDAGTIKKDTLLHEVYSLV